MEYLIRPQWWQTESSLRTSSRPVDLFFRFVSATSIRIQRADRYQTCSHKDNRLQCCKNYQVQTVKGIVKGCLRQTSKICQAATLARRQDGVLWVAWVISHQDGWHRKYRHSGKGSQQAMCVILIELKYFWFVELTWVSWGLSVLRAGEN